MNIKDITLFIVVDEQHEKELRLTMPTWVKFRPEMIGMPVLLMYDSDWYSSNQQALNDFVQFVNNLGFLDIRVVPWNMKADSQREKMLSAFVLGSTEIKTEWYLKMDTDALATMPGDWLQDEWFLQSQDGRLPVFITSPWGYTKPAEFIERLEDWGDGVEGLKEYPRLNIQKKPGAVRLRHPRIISWCYFGNTEWTQKMAGLCKGKLPIPSQDTFLFYCAARRKEHYHRIRMATFGWSHIGRKFDHLAQICRRVMDE